MTPDSIYEFQAGVYRTLSNAIRLEILYFLRPSPKCVNDIAQAIGRPANVISRHLKVLRNGDIVTTQRHGQEIVYQIANPKIITICDLMREVLSEEAIHRSRLVQGLSDEHSG
jgi:ArsR family transcriptional regulator